MFGIDFTFLPRLGNRLTALFIFYPCSLELNLSWKGVDLRIGHFLLSAHYSNHPSIILWLLHINRQPSNLWRNILCSRSFPSFPRKSLFFSSYPTGLFTLDNYILSHHSNRFWQFSPLFPPRLCFSNIIVFFLQLLNIS